MYLISQKRFMQQKRPLFYGSLLFIPINYLPFKEHLVWYYFFTVFHAIAELWLQLVPDVKEMWNSISWAAGICTNHSIIVKVSGIALWHIVCSMRMMCGIAEHWKYLSWKLVYIGATFNDTNVEQIVE